MSERKLPTLKIERRRARRYARGHEVHEQILRATLQVLIEKGAGSLTMRRIAAECGLQPGHLAYYFPSKQELIRELLDALVAEYIEAIEVIMHTSGASAEERLERVVMQIIDDISTKKTTRVFTELWAMSNHDEFVQDRVEELYQRGYAVFDGLIEELNPSLSSGDREILLLFIRTTLEGTTISAGYGKPWHRSLLPLGRLAAKSLLTTISSITPAEIRDCMADAQVAAAGSNGPEDRSNPARKMRSRT